MVKIGGGFAFHVLRCDKCGKEKSISFKALGELHLKYLKGLPGPWSVATSESDKHVLESYSGDPISEDEYHARVEAMAKKCRCGGKYKFDAPPRCPRCRSENISQEGLSLMFGLGQINC